TIDIELPEVDYVTSAELKAIISNDFPAQIKTQVHFLDDNNHVIDILFDDEGLDITAAALNNNSQTTTSVEKTVFLNFDRDRYEKVRKASKIAIIGYLNTTNSDQK